MDIIVWLYDDKTKEFIKKKEKEEFVDIIRKTRYQTWPASWTVDNIWYWTSYEFNELVENSQLNEDTLYFTLE